MFQHKKKAHVTSNFKCLIETEGLLEGSASHVHGACGNISDKVQGRDVVSLVTADPLIESDISYQIAAIPLTLSELGGY